MSNRGYFGIGIEHGKTGVNLGTLWRSAYQLGASFIFTIGRRYALQASDTPKTHHSVPLYHYDNLDHFNGHRPHGCRLIGVEFGGKLLEGFWHPERAIYLLGAEDHGLTKRAQAMCNGIVTLSSVRLASYNVAVAGSLVMYSRLQQQSNPVGVHALA